MSAVFEPDGGCLRVLSAEDGIACFVCGSVTSRQSIKLALAERLHHSFDVKCSGADVGEKLDRVEPLLDELFRVHECSRLPVPMHSRHCLEIHRVPVFASPNLAPRLLGLSGCASEKDQALVRVFSSR